MTRELGSEQSVYDGGEHDHLVPNRPTVANANAGAASVSRIAHHDDHPKAHHPVSDPTVKQIQTELARLGLYDFKIDGLMGPRSRAGLDKAIGPSWHNVSRSTLVVKLRAITKAGGDLHPAPTGTLGTPEHEAQPPSGGGGGVWDWIVGHTKSAALSLIDLLPIKPDSPYSTTFLKHYVEGSGAPYAFKDIPVEWQTWIVNATQGQVGNHAALSPYNSGIYDLRNSLGHFDAQVTRNPDGTKTYSISDVYQFGFRENDGDQRGRHGFPLGQLSENELYWFRMALPGGEYDNPGGFKERWEVKTVGKETFLLIPQGYLAKQGTPFAVSGSFCHADPAHAKVAPAHPKKSHG